MELLMRQEKTRSTSRISTGKTDTVIDAKTNQPLSTIQLGGGAGTLSMTQRQIVSSLPLTVVKS
jgi:hypothetical protein